jgi:anti-anti-sigma factor
LPLEGEIDLHISPEVAAELEKLIKEKPKKLVIDLSKVTFLDSSGLSVCSEECKMSNITEETFIWLDCRKRPRPFLKVRGWIRHLEYCLTSPPRWPQPKA